MQLQKILLPTDLSPEGDRAVAEVGEVALRNGARILLLHVVEDVGVRAGEPRPQGIPGTREELARARELLDERRKAFPPGVEVLAEVIAAPSVSHAIIEYAKKNGCDAIALSTHGRGGFRRWIVGSVTEAVLRRSPVPVIVFPRES